MKYLSCLYVHILMNVAAVINKLHISKHLRYKVATSLFIIYAQQYTQHVAILLTHSILIYLVAKLLKIKSTQIFYLR